LGCFKSRCDRGTVLLLIAKVEAFYKNEWEAKDTISSYTSRLKDLYLSLENTTQQSDLAVHILIDRLPDCYKAEGQAAKQQNLSFVATTAYLLANIKDRRRQQLWPSIGSPRSPTSPKCWQSTKRP